MNEKSYPSRTYGRADPNYRKASLLKHSNANKFNDCSLMTIEKVEGGIISPKYVCGALKTLSPFFINKQKKIKYLL